MTKNTNNDNGNGDERRGVEREREAHNSIFGSDVSDIIEHLEKIPQVDEVEYVDMKPPRHVEKTNSLLLELMFRDTARKRGKVEKMERGGEQ